MRSPHPLVFALLGVLALTASGFMAFRRPLHFDSAWTEAARAAIERATGLNIAVRGPVEVTVFPRPMLMARDVEIRQAGSDTAVQASSVQGLLSLTGLLFGQPGFDKLEIADASGIVDADKLVELARLGDPSHGAGLNLSDPQVPATVSITGANLQLRSTYPGLSGFLTDIHLLIGGLRGGSASIAGGANWHGEHADMTGRLDSLAMFLDGRPTTGSLKLKSRIGTASVTGTLEQGRRGWFKGSVAVSAPALSSLLRMAGLPPGVLAGIGHFSFTGTADPTQDGFVFGDAHVSVNDDSLEGTLGLQTQDNHLSLVGTLATERLDATPFVATLPPARTADGSWNTEAIPFSAVNLHDTDLRLSVGRLVVNDIHADDVALSILRRQGRMELSLGEARAYGGLVKARLFTTGSPVTSGIKADLSWSQVDTASLAKALPDWLSGIAGLSSGFVSVEGDGGNAEQIVESLSGKGQANWRQGQLPALPTVAALLQIGSGANPAPVDFDLASLDFTINDGLLTLGKASVFGPNLRVKLAGETNLPIGSYLLTSSAEASADPAVQPDTRRIAGFWGGTSHTAELPGGAHRPAVPEGREGYYP